MMLLSSKRKFNNIEKTDLIAPEVKRGKVSEGCDLSSLLVDENIPHNMQAGGTNTAGAKAKESAVDVSGCEKQKPSRKKLLNLKKGKTVRNTKKKKGETESCLINNYSSTIIDKQCSNKVDDQGDIMKGHESPLKCLGHDDHTDVQCCPVCRNDVSMLESDTELSVHINNCLDDSKNDFISSTETSTSAFQKEFCFCEICKRDISTYNTVQRQQHYNRCCDNMEEPRNEVAQKQLSCLVCGKICKTLKSRQSHMKRCAKKNNVSTTKLVELNRNENIKNQIDNGKSSEFACGSVSVKANGAKIKERTNRRKNNTRLQGKNLDDETQLALALSASLQSNEKDNKGLEKRSKKKHKGQYRTEVPALLLRNGNEMKKVTEARAAAVLCRWADSDEEIQSTPALAPSSLLKKFSSNSETDVQSVDATDQLETVSEHSEPNNEDNKDLTEKSEDKDMEVSMSNTESERESDVIKKNAVIEKANQCQKSDKMLSAVTTAKKVVSDQKKLTIDKETRLWRISSLCAENLSEANFYVPNLLPKTTPRKKKVVARSSSQATKLQKECHTANNEDKDEEQVLHVKTTNENERITESQEMDIQLLAELVGEERSDDIQSKDDERENNEELEETWYHSSGFCVTNDIHGHERENNKNTESLLNDLSSMVGNRLLSDVKILAKNGQKFFAHSFMLVTRCDTLAKMIKEKASDSEDVNNVITLDMVDIDIRAIRAIMTYIYTASYVPVNHYVSKDVKKLVHRLNLNCDVDAWKDLNDSVHRDKEVLLDREEDLELDGEIDGEEGNERANDLDVLLKSLWEGEDITENTAEDVENAFGDSVLDEDLNDMEIKIYTQVTPKKNTASTAETDGLKLKASKKVKGKSFIEDSLLHSDLDKDVAGLSTSDCRGEDLSLEKSIVNVNESLNCDDIAQQNETRCHPSSPALSLSSVNTFLELNIDNKDGDISGDSDDWFVTQTPQRPAHDLRFHKSRIKYEHEVDVEPKKAIVLTRNQQDKQQCRGDTSDSHVRAFKRRISSDGDVNSCSHTYPMTPERHSSLNKSHVSCTLSRHNSSNSIISPLSPVVVSPTSPKPIFSETDHGNSAMDTEDGNVSESDEPGYHELVNSEVQADCKTSLNFTENLKKSSTENRNVDCELDVSVSSSSPRNMSSSECVSENKDDLNENDDYFGNSYDDEDFCNDDGGFNCDIVDYLDTSCKLDADLEWNATEMEHAETEEPAKEEKSKAISCKKQVKDNREKKPVSKRSQAVGNKRKQLEPQNSKTPMLNYSNMATPDLTVELKQYGVRALPKRKMVVKLKEIYQFTHQDTTSESELEEKNHQKPAAAETMRCNQETSEESKTHRNKLDEESTQDSGESSESSGGFSDGESSKDDDILSQESSLCLSKKLMKSLTQNDELYLRILRYEPVPLTSIEEILKENKIKCSSAKLKNFLDEQCITFTEPRTARTRTKKRRTKPKSQKNN